MTGPDLPQPIYPTPGPGGGGPAGPPPSWPPAGPPGPPGGPSPYGPGQPFGAPAGPPAGGSGSKLSGGVIAAIAVGLVAIVAIALVVVNGGDDETAGGDGPRVTVTTPGTTGGDGPGPTTDGGGGADPDLEARAATVAANQIVGASGSTVDCLAQSLVDDPELLDAIEPQSTGVSFDAEEDAQHYASFIMLCAPPDEVKQVFLDAYSQQGLDELQLGCLDTEMSTWTVDMFEEFVALVAQPSRASEANDAVLEITANCY